MSLLGAPGKTRHTVGPTERSLAEEGESQAESEAEEGAWPGEGRGRWRGRQGGAELTDLLSCTHVRNAGSCVPKHSGDSGLRKST